MSIDASNIPISPSFMLTAAVVAGVFAFGIAPEIARREILRSNWQEICRNDLRADVEATRTPAQVIPQMPDLCGIVGDIYPELSGICSLVPDPNAAVKETERRLQEAETARINRKLEGTADRCTCAQTVYIEEERLSLALYAASGRLITPSSVKNRKSVLSKALHSPACRLGGEQ